ncbi:hypothetical protein BJ684DRAFT_16703 [Piptocephalis cylindrospora]|uniref:Guanine nucleotide-binding protein-like 1 n=1 Tax=Piptocephalis cylindrospora TaxID=1907219 RepID=A0A4V1IY02_9FUNG|nr:hypothetical protein BJ684DRAFT_16703 [Piptocephalis cylindrospora]|eukprot:RKP12849.1 hypothetical protein BJ684DRAFT_16703 [Piptocephalis cylindrospora]
MVMMTAHQKKPFSAKQKKAQLQEKRQRKRQERQEEEAEEELEVQKQQQELQQQHNLPQTIPFVPESTSEKPSKDPSKLSEDIDHLIRISSSKGNEASDPRRLVSAFRKLTPQDISEGIRQSQQPLEPTLRGKVQVSVETVYPEVLPFPKRPTWSSNESKEKLEGRERAFFRDWLTQLYTEYDPKDLSHFEHNLEVWRQLWRVLEMSDILLFVVDVRHPLLHFPPALYTHADLVVAETTQAWKEYLERRLPGVHVVSFASFTQGGEIIDDIQLESLQRRFKKAKEKKRLAQGAVEVLQACRDSIDSIHDSSDSWTSQPWWESTWSEAKSLAEEREGKVKEEDVEGHSDEEGEDQASLKDLDDSVEEGDARRQYLTIGMIGHPNVGKSSLINRMMGRTVVSSSKTPGHTKHFQTLHLTQHLRLCDGPGLVFPSLLPRPLQILSGMYNLAQVQEPYTSVQYLAERIPIHAILRLGNRDEVWSAYDICDAYAIDQGMMTAKNSRPDVGRAANRILRLANDGRLLLAFHPPVVNEDSPPPPDSVNTVAPS